jgi:hypothetical protein
MAIRPNLALCLLGFAAAALTIVVMALPGLNEWTYIVAGTAGVLSLTIAIGNVGSLARVRRGGAR